MLIDFSGPHLIGSRNSCSLRCLTEHTGAVLQSPFLSPNAAITIPWPSVPSSLSLAVPAHLLLQQSHSAQPTGPASHICKATHPQCWCEGRKTVCTTKAKEGGTIATTHLLLLLQKQGTFLTLFMIHSLDKRQPPPRCSGQVEYWSETQA